MEKQFTLSCGEVEIPCRLLASEEDGIRRLVLGVHGFGGCATDAIQSGIAEEMEMFYAATLRFDFPAHGESPLDSSYLTLQNCRDTLLTVAKWFRDQYPEVEDLCIFATGFGAYVTLLELENLVVSDEEMDAALEVVCRQNNMTVDMLKPHIDEEFTAAITRSILMGKVMRLIRDAAEVVDA